MNPATSSTGGTPQGSATSAISRVAQPTIAPAALVVADAAVMASRQGAAVPGVATIPGVLAAASTASELLAPVAAAIPRAAAALPTRDQVIATVTVRVAQAFDRLGNWLSDLPVNPFTNYLAGALQLVRRALLPNVPTIPKLTVSNTSVLEGDSGTTDAVFTITLDKAYTSPVTVAYNNGIEPYLVPIMHDELKQFLWGHINFGNPDIAADTLAFMVEFDPDLFALLDDDELEQMLQAIRAAKQGQDYLPVSGLLTFAPGQTSQQVSVTVLGDTTDEPTETFDLNVYPTLLSGTAASAVTDVLLGRGIGTIIGDDNPACVQTKDCSNQWLQDRQLRGDLSGVNFTKADLNEATLTGATLTGAILTGANLSFAHLEEATLTRANLSGATLNFAHLSDAHLEEANLTGANLIHTDLTDAFLSGADLTGANLVSAFLDGADLTGVTWHSEGAWHRDGPRYTTCPDGTKTYQGCSGSQLIS